MKITVFQSDKGDCLLLTGADTKRTLPNGSEKVTKGKRILVDGGMSVSYTAHVSPHLNKMLKNKEKLDLVYVSHIDDDHIGGILRMMDDEVDWRVHERLVKTGNPQHKAPQSQRPPQIAHIWHNAFHMQVEKNAGKIEEMLAASAIAFSGLKNKDIMALAATHACWAESVRQAIQLTQRVARSQLNIHVNKPAKGKLMLVRDTKRALKFGGMSIFIIGPFKEDLDKLRKDWNKWLEENAEMLKKIKQQAEADHQAIGNEVDKIIKPLLTQAKTMGDRNLVTPPNLASLMLMVKEGDKTVILTGDGHADDIIKGLEHYGVLDAGNKDDTVHVDVLKVQHHGSEHNIHERFCKKVTADKYIFCGNGFSTNPELDVIDLIVKSRLADGSTKKFKLFFNSNSSVPPQAANRAHMKKVEQQVAKLSAQSDGRMSFSFLDGDNDKFDIQV